jgi:ABC-type glycerol-3-phosphate transport system substrate-binding protein
MQLLDFTAKKGNYDLVMQSSSFFGVYASDGYLEPLDKYFNNPKLLDKKAFDLDDFNKHVLAQVGSYKGKTYALPYMYFPQIMVYRADLFEKLNLAVPKTMDEYLKVVQKLDTVQGVRGTCVIGIKGGAGGNVYGFAPYLFNFGGEYAKNGKLTLNSPAAVKALEYYLQLMKHSPSEAINNGTDQVTSAFGAGGLGVIFMDADNAGALLDPNFTKFNKVTKYAVLPEGAYKGTLAGQGTPLLGAWSMGVSAFSKHKAEAFRFMTFILGKDHEVTGTFVKYGINPRLSVLHKYSETYPNYALVAKEIPDSKTIPAIAHWPEIEEILSNALAKAMMGQVKPKEALDEAQRLATAVLNKK